MHENNSRSGLVILFMNSFIIYLFIFCRPLNIFVCVTFNTSLKKKLLEILVFKKT